VERSSGATDSSRWGSMAKLNEECGVIVVRGGTSALASAAVGFMIGSMVVVYSGMLIVEERLLIGNHQTGERRASAFCPHFGYAAGVAYAGERRAPLLALAVRAEPAGDQVG
jgi:hypothetical protein